MRQWIIAEFAVAWFAVVTFAQRQYFQIRPTNTTVAQGDTTVLQCTVGNQAQQGQTFWTKDGGVLGFDDSLEGFPRYRVIGDHSKGEYHLEISDAKIEDDDIYECQVQPGEGDDAGLRAKAYVNVLVPPANITLDSTGGGVVEARKDVILEVSCRVDGAKPAADIQWYKNGIAIPEHLYENRYVAPERKLSSTVSSLRWTAAKDDNGAVFTCIVIHPAVPASRPLKSQFVLSVLYPPGVPVITGYDTERILIAEEFLQLKCAVENGNPPPDLVWYRNGAVVGRNSTVLQGSTRNDYGFIVKSIDDSADYRCEASNSATAAPLSSNVRLRVYFPPEKVEITGPDEATVGDVITLQCKSSASQPQAKIEWLIDGKPWTDHIQRNKPAATGTGTEAVSSIDIKVAHTRPQLVAVCSSSNEHLPRSTKTEVVAKKHIKVYYPPEQVKITYNDNKPLVAGETILLTCTATGGYPAATLEWFRNEKRITSGASAKHGADNSAISELTLTLSPHNNLEQVQCRAYNLASGSYRLTDTIALHVQFSPDSVRISPEPPEFRAGSPAEMVCESASGNPSPAVDWYRDNELLPSVVAQNKTGPYGGWIVNKKLFLSPTVEDDGAVYECRAWSDIPTVTPVSERVALSVHYKPVFMASTQQSLQVLEGETVVLNATANANPAIEQYVWMKDDLASYILRSTPAGMIVNGPILEMAQIRRTDAGVYTCRAKNAVGASNLTAVVTVKYPAEITHISPQSFAAVGDNVTLTCQVDAYPIDTVTIRWETKEGDRLPAVGRFLESSAGGRGTLAIFGVQTGDTKEYVCKADNGIGTASAKTAILVKQSPIFDKESNAGQMAAEIGSEAVVRCAADGVPQPAIRWHRESEDEFGARTLYRLPDDDRVHSASDKAGLTRVTSELRIKKVHDADYGLYICVAENDEGADSVAVRLRATSPPDPPDDVRILNHTHDAVTLTWRPGFDGGLAQYFRVCYSIGAVVTRNSDPCVRTSDTTLTVTNLYPRTKYAFIVDAVNAKGASADTKPEMVETLSTSSLSQELLEEEIPVLIIILVCLVGAFLLVLNAALVVCFIRRHRRKKMQAAEKRKVCQERAGPCTAGAHCPPATAEKASTARLGNESNRKIQMYSSSDAAAGSTAAASASRGGDSAATSRRADAEEQMQRPNSAISDDDTSIRTVIELDGAGQPVFNQGNVSPRLMHAAVCTAGNFGAVGRDFNEHAHPNGPPKHLVTDAMYSVQPTAFYSISAFGQEQNQNPCIPAHIADDMVPAALGPLRSLSQELNNYAAYSHYQPLPSVSSSTRHQHAPRRYSPPNSGQPPVSTVVHSNGRTPYAEVRPILTSHHRSQSPAAPGQQGADRTGGGSPILTTFASAPVKASNAKADYLEVDGLAGDLV